MATKIRRRNLDAAAFAGSALVLWIAAELAQLGEFRFLQALYGLLDGALLSWAAWVSWRGGSLRTR